MTVTQSDKAMKFRALHQAPDAFVVANVWDGGSARMMAGLGFPALATSSGASAGLLGRRDGRVTRDEALAQARVICEATDLPVSADLEKGFGDAPEIVAQTIGLAARRASSVVRSRTQAATRLHLSTNSARRPSGSPPPRRRRGRCRSHLR